MRIGSLEITAALALVALLAARPRIRAGRRHRCAHADAGRSGNFRPRLSRARGTSGRLVEIGRTRAADLVLRDPEVSRRHARFESHNGVVYVEDLESSNGTFLNGRRVTEAIEVRVGDEIDVGTTRLVVTSVRPD